MANFNLAIFAGSKKLIIIVYIDKHTKRQQIRHSRRPSCKHLFNKSPSPPPSIESFKIKTRILYFWMQQKKTCKFTLKRPRVSVWLTAPSQCFLVSFVSWSHFLMTPCPGLHFIYIFDRLLRDKGSLFFPCLNFMISLKSIFIKKLQ